MPISTSPGAPTRPHSPGEPATPTDLPPPPGGARWPAAPAPLAVPPTPLLVALAAGVAVIGDVGLQAGFVGVAAAQTVLAAAVALLVSGRLERTAGRWLVGAAPVFGLWLAVRTSPWLLPFDVAAALGLLVLGATMARGGTVRDLVPVAFALRFSMALHHLVGAPGLLRGWAGARRPARRAVRWQPIARGLLLALPVVGVLGGLLASADAVFASIFDLALRPDRVAAHAFGLVVAGWWGLGLLRVASASDVGEPDAPRRWLGRTEATIVLGSVVLLFGAFVATQIVAATGGADHVLDTTGLTRAEYARSGFFQLLWVAALVIVGLVVVAHGHDLARPGARRIRLLAAAVVVLAIAIVAVAVVRLDLYRDAYGWTMLRLSCTAFAGWLGVVLALLGVCLAGPAPLRRLGWFAPAALASGLAVLLALNAVNPEAMVARHNLTRDNPVVDLDTTYFSHLSDDALPTIVSLLPTLDPDAELAVRRQLGCAPAGHDGGWPGWNLGHQRANDAQRELCQG